jgi:hypothetical protein
VKPTRGKQTRASRAAGMEVVLGAFGGDSDQSSTGFPRPGGAFPPPAGTAGAPSLGGSGKGADRYSCGGRRQCGTHAGPELGVPHPRWLAGVEEGSRASTGTFPVHGARRPFSYQSTGDEAVRPRFRCVRDARRRFVPNVAQEGPGPCRVRGALSQPPLGGGTTFHLDVLPARSRTRKERGFACRGTKTFGLNGCHLARALLGEICIEPTPDRLSVARMRRRRPASPLDRAETILGSTRSRMMPSLWIWGPAPLPWNLT